MIIRLISAIKVEPYAQLVVGVTQSQNPEIQVPFQVLLTDLATASTKAAKRQVLIAAFRIVFQPPPPVQMDVSELGVDIGTSVDLG